EIGAQLRRMADDLNA
nr:Chain E, Bcl-2-binding component 3, isoforms 1/2 [Homo sapiens]